MAVEHLVQRGADPMGRDGHDRTALDYATKWAPQDIAVGDQKEMIARYLAACAKAKNPAMTEIAQTLTERRARVWDIAEEPEPAMQVVEAQFAIVR